ncbi:hypothetical protein JB92DRAFT_3113381 [Gautieria morchelliformis]|nr:hypothetical protein JB92DRAFT_3113381 [Gautieria morchelliformis]
MPITLKTTLKHLDLADRFTIFVVCPQCNSLHDLLPEPDRSADALCTLCASGLYTGFPSLFSTKSKPKFKPKLSAPSHLVSSLLVDFLAWAGIEEAVEQWRYDPRQDGIYKDIMDGQIWKNLEGPDGNTFFAHNLESDELRIGLTLSLDCMTTGDREPTAEELQQLLILVVDDLLRLCYDGIKIVTPSHPQGRLVRVALVAMMHHL